MTANPTHGPGASGGHGAPAPCTVLRATVPVVGGGVRRPVRSSLVGLLPGGVQQCGEPVQLFGPRGAIRTGRTGRLDPAGGTATASMADTDLPRLSARPRSRTTSRSTTSAELDLKGAGGDLPQLLLRAASGPAPASAPRSARSPSVGGPAAGTSRGDRPRSSSEACAWVPGRGTTGRPARDSMRSVNSSTVVPLSASKS